MNPQERAMIDGLFERLRPLADAPRDAEAEALIARRTGEQPHAPYALAQTVLVQEHALTQAQARIEALEAQLAQAARADTGSQAPSSFLGGLAGGRATSVPRAGTPPIGERGAFADPSPAAAGMPMAPARGGFGGGGGFLASAMTTAAGVAGGALLVHGISSMLGGGEAKAADAGAGEAAGAASPWGAAKDDAGKDDAAKDTGTDTAGTDTDDAASGDTGIDPFGDDTASAQDADFDDGGFDDDSIGGGDWV